MGRPSRDAEILAAALAVFAERGYDGTRVRDIARRAGVSEAALYCHHASKEALALALFATHMRNYSDALAEIASDTSRTVPERVGALAEWTLQAYARDPDAVAFVLTHQTRFIGRLPAEFQFAIRVVERLIAAGQRDGSVRAGPPRLLAALVFGCIVQPIRTHMEAPAGTIDVASARARAIVADAALAAIAAQAVTRVRAHVPARGGRRSRGRTAAR